MMTSEEEEDEVYLASLEPRNIWKHQVMGDASSSSASGPRSHRKGKQLALASQALYESDVFARAGVTYRNDYAPKGRELRALEDLPNKIRKE